MAGEDLDHRPRKVTDRKHSPLRITAVLLAIALVTKLTCSDLLEQVELLVFDAAFHLRHALGFAEPLAEEIAIVGVEPGDVAELAEEFTATAEALRLIADLGASVIAIDVVYLKASQRDQREIADAINEIRSSGVQIVLPTMIDQQDGLPVLRRGLSLAGAVPGPYGLVNAEIHLDQLWRTYRMAWPVGENCHPSLALAAHVAYAGVEAPEASGDGRLEWQELADGSQLVSRYADTRRHLLNFREPYESDRLDTAAGIGGRFWNLRDLASFRATDADTPMKQPLGGKIVFFGYNGGSDRKATTFGHVPGVLIHAQALSDFRQGLQISRAATWIDALLLVVVAALALGVFRIAPNPSWLLALAPAVAIGIIAFVLWLLWDRHLMIGGASLLLLWFAICASETLRRFLIERDTRVQTEAVLGLYFSPSVLNQVKRDPGSRSARRTEAVVVLSDLRNFSAISESCELEDVHDMLNRAFEIQCDEAMREDGSLANFAGDQFLAYWGAPQAQPDAADRALRAVLRMSSRLEELRTQLKPEIRSLFGYGFGLHRGVVLFGNKGSSRFLNFAIIGDTVNATARMESLTKHYRVPILASGEFCESLTSGDSYRERLIDHIRVKGKQRPLALHQFAPTDSDWPPREEFGAAMKLYRQAEFDQAHDAFARLLQQSGDPICEVLAQRCVDLCASPPPDWHGIYTFETK